jgi:DNA-binding MarR family transcriptional regulator
MVPSRSSVPSPDEHVETLARVELQVALLLRRATRPIRAHTADDLDRSGYLILHDLMERGPIHVNGLAEHLGLDSSTVTRQVGLLEKAGRVRRTRDPFDGRGIVVEPTAAGLDDLAAHRQQRGELYSEILQGWSALDRALLAELLERLNGDLDASRRTE